MSPKPVFLDVDSSIVERNLQITKNADDEEFNKLLTSTEEYPSKLIKPIPGFCIKTKEVGSDIKVFVNICQTDALPPPEDLSDDELASLCSSDEPCNFRIPLSIGEIRLENDNKGVDAKAVDVAINPKFFHKIENSPLFKNFFLAVVFEGLSDKHHLHVTDERILLKNRKSYGNLQLHRIQQREIDEKINRANNLEKIQLESSTSKPKIEVLASTSYDKDDNDEPKTPVYRLFRKSSEANILYGEFNLANLLETDDMTLDIGEDRILLESKKFHYFLDVFLPCDIVSENVIASFNTKSKILTIKMSTKST